MAITEGLYGCVCQRCALVYQPCDSPLRVALPYVTEWLKNDTPVYESIRQGMADV